MIKGLFENSSAGRKLLLFVFLSLGALVLASVFSYLITMIIWGKEVLLNLSNPDLNDSRIVEALKMMQLVNSIGGMLLPAVAFLWVADAGFFISSKKSSRINLLAAVLTIIFILSIQPFIGLLTEWNEMMRLPASLSGLENMLKSWEENALAVTKTFVATDSVSGLLFNMLLIAVLPAISEELMFRAALGRLFQKMTGSIHWAAILSAIIFSAFHMQFYGFLPRFVLGLGLAYLFFWSGNIWWPILAHFINNGVTVFAAYLFQNGYSNLDPEQIGTFDSMYPGVFSLLITVLILFIFKRIHSATSVSPA